MSMLDIFKIWKLYNRIKLLKEDKVMQEKLKSRKLWVTVLTTALVTINSAVGLVPEDTMHWLIGFIGTYLAGQSAVDAVQGGTPTTPK